MAKQRRWPDGVPLLLRRAPALLGGALPALPDLPALPALPALLAPAVASAPVAGARSVVHA
jgi:hypothetical protein